MGAKSVEARIILAGVFEPDEDGGYIASCPELAIHTEGDTLDEATANLIEAVDCYLATAVELGHIDGLLQRLMVSQQCKNLEKVFKGLKPKQVMNRIDRHLVPA